MAPAFGLLEAKGLLPCFMDAATKACELCLYFISGADLPGLPLDGRHVECRHWDQQVWAFSHCRCESMVRKGYS